MKLVKKSMLICSLLSLLLHHKAWGGPEEEFVDENVRRQTRHLTLRATLAAENLTITEVLDPRRPGNLIAPYGYKTLLGEGLLVILPNLLCKQYKKSGLRLRDFLRIRYDY
jgi:hypothetical protein